MAAQVVLVIIFRVLGAGLLLAAQVVLSGKYGAAITGEYFLLFSAMIIGSVLGRQGLSTWAYQAIVSRETAPSNERIQAISSVSLLRSAFGSLIVASLLVFLCGMMSEVITIARIIADNPALYVICVVSFSLIITVGEILKAQKQTIASLNVTGIFYPIALLVLVYFWVDAARSKDLFISHGVATGVNLILALAVLWRHGLLKLATPRGDSRAQLRLADFVPLWINSIVHRGIIPWSPIIVVSFFATAEEVGWFSVANRVAVLASFFSVSVISIAYPREIAKLPANRTGADFHSITRRLAFVMGVLTVPAALIAVIWAEPILLIFGKEFSAGADALRFLVFAQLAFSFAQVFLYYFISNKEQNTILRSSIVFGGAMILLPTIAMMLSGMIAACIAIVLSNIVYLIYLAFEYHNITQPTG